MGNVVGSMQRTSLVASAFHTISISRSSYPLKLFKRAGGERALLAYRTVAGLCFSGWGLELWGGVDGGGGFFVEMDFGLSGLGGWRWMGDCKGGKGGRLQRGLVCVERGMNFLKRGGGGRGATSSALVRLNPAWLGDWCR